MADVAATNGALFGADPYGQSATGGVLGKVKKQLNTVSKTLDQTDVRTRAMERKLREVEELPGEMSSDILDLPETSISEGPDGEENK